jgi:hypothetical protein
MVINTPVDMNIQLSSAVVADQDYSIGVTNTWVLRCDYGSGTISGSSDIMFIGVQRANGGSEEEIDLTSHGVAEVTIVAALPEFARLYSAERFGLYVLNNATESDTERRRQGIVYQTVFPESSHIASVVDTFQGTRSISMHTVNINNALLERMKYVCGCFRVHGDTIKSIRFYHEHLRFYYQKTTDNLGVTDGVVANASTTANNFQGGSPPSTQELWWILATAIDDSAIDFDTLGHGLFIKSGSSGSLLEGETVADMINNFNGGNGSKCAYAIRSNKMVLSCGTILEDFANDYGATQLTYNVVNQTADTRVKISRGVPGGIIRSATINVDTNGSDDEGEFKYQIGGNLSEVDYSVKTMITSNLRAREYDHKWGNTNGNTDVTAYLSNPLNISWRQADYDLRKYYYVRTVSGLSSGLTDHKLLMVAHPFVEYSYNGSWQSITPSTYAMDVDHWKGTFIQQQSEIGIGNVLAKYVGIALSNSRRAKIECKTSIELFDVNMIGRNVRVTFDGMLSGRYADLHDTGQTYSTGLVLDVKSSIITGLSDVTIVLLPK